MRTFTLALFLATALSAPALAQEPEERRNARIERNDTRQSDGGQRWGGGRSTQSPQAAPQQPRRPFGGFGGRDTDRVDGGERRMPRGGWGEARAAQPNAPAPVASPAGGRFGGTQSQTVTPQRADRPFGMFGGRNRGNDGGGERRRGGWGEARAAQPSVTAPAVAPADGGFRSNRPVETNQVPVAQPDRQFGGVNRRDGDRDSGRRGGWRSGDRDFGQARPGGNGNGRDRNWGDRRNGDGDRSGNGRSWRSDRYDRRGDGYRDRNRWSGRDGRPGDWNNGGHDRGHHWNGRNDRWDRGWRNNNRYNWYSYRSYNRNLYRAPRYYNPYGYGYGYNRFSIGIYLNSLFYSSNHWINDPWSYRLPESTWPYRWVRYYDDVLLVDVRSGYVVDAIYGFFW